MKNGIEVKVKKGSRHSHLRVKHDKEVSCLYCLGNKGSEE